MPARRVAGDEAALTRLIGVLVLAGIAVFLALAYLRPNPFDGKRELTAVFDSFENVGVVPIEVRVAGASVGEVTDRRRVGDDALVTMELDPEVEVYANATAKLRPRLAFEGTGFIELDPGTPARGEIGEEGIAKADTSSQVGLGDALRLARPDTREALKRDVRGLNAALTPAARAALQRTLRNGPALTRDLALGARAAQGPTRSELAGVVDGFARTVEGVQREEQSLAPVLRGARATLAAMNVDGDRALERTVAELPARLGGISAGARELRGVIDRLDPLSVDLRPGLERLAPTLARTRPLLSEARPVLRDLVPFARELRSAVDAGAESTPPTRRLLGEVRSTTSLLNDSLLPALTEPSRYGVPVYRQFFAMFQGGAGAFGAFQDDSSPDPRCGGPTLLNPTCQRLGNGHYARFGAIFDIVRQPVLPCDPRTARCSPQQNEEAAGER